MNPTMIEAFIRQVLPIVGTMLTIFGVKSATANALVDMIMTITGPAITIGSVVWMFIRNTTGGLISQAAALPEVQSIKLEPAAPTAIVQATPANVNK